MLTVETRRVSGEGDLEALRELFEVITTCDGHAPIGEHKYLDLIAGGNRDSEDRLIEVDGSPIGYVTAKPTDDRGTWAMEMAVHPLHRNADMMDRVVEIGVGLVRARRGTLVRAWAFSAPVVAALRDSGFEPERELRQLRRSLPHPQRPEFPAGVTVQGFRPGRDEEVWLSLNNAAFAWHPENGAWTTEILTDRMRQGWFSADGFRMAWEDGALVGFCWTKMHDRRIGEIYVIAVAPQHRGRGLGRAMVLEGLRWLSESEGARVAMLYVDSDNHGGLELYDRLGFELDHVDRSFTRAVVPDVASPPVEGV